MGGDVGVESEPGNGSTFWFTMRLEPSGSRRTEKEAAPKALAPSQVTGRALVAEDNLINQKVARHLLERMGCRVDTVANGREAVDAMRRARYDLVLMDCQMPELDGYAAAREIRKSEAPVGRSTPIIALTANAQQGDREQCIAARDERLPLEAHSRRGTDRHRQHLAREKPGSFSGIGEGR
jgi:CheY-like chemotaxis protein